VDINSYGSYINNSANGLIQTSICGDITFTSEFKPAEYLAISEIKKHNLEVNDVNYNKALEEKVNTKTFFLKIKSKLQSDFLKDGLKNKDDYYLRLNYYNSEINADISLIQGTDTINCLYSYFQRNFNIGSESTIIIGFEDKHSNKTNEDLRLIVNERALGCGMLDFRIKNEDILKIPQVKI
jgi:hypothetical protein